MPAAEGAGRATVEVTVRVHVPTPDQDVAAGLRSVEGCLRSLAEVRELLHGLNGPAPPALLDATLDAAVHQAEEARWRLLSLLPERTGDEDDEGSEWATERDRLRTERAVAAPDE